MAAVAPFPLPPFQSPFALSSLLKEAYRRAYACEMSFDTASLRAPLSTNGRVELPFPFPAPLPAANRR